MSENSNIIDVTETEFNDQVIEASESKLIVVDFWAPWCGPCKQLTPILEKIISKSGDKITLVKINIDENQQIAAQLRIQSIPTVYAFKDKQIVNAFQGVIPEGQIIEFIEKCLGSKINEDFTEFYNEIESAMAENKFEETKDTLLEFISKNSDEIRGICFYLECLVELKQFEEVEVFINSLEKDVQQKDEVKQVLKKMEIVKKNSSGPNINELLGKLENEPNNIDLVLEISDKYFSMKEYENGMDLLLKNYPKNKDSIKNKMVEFFAVLGNTDQVTIQYRKKLSQLIFS
ncbi:thioredoxin [Pelagibacteraceae bacterium]|nr:thioredoxin [Pelagibacteraceae bacterium]